MVDENSQDKMENLETEEIENEPVEGIGEKTEELEAKDEEIANLKNQLLRLQADFMNFKRRNEEAKQSSMDYAVEKFALDILPCIDNFERALESNNEEKGGFYEGVSLIYHELMRVLDKNNIEEIKSLDEEFDPNIHHAVFLEEVEGVEPDRVTDVLQKGYQLKDKVIRPAMVKVSK